MDIMFIRAIGSSPGLLFRQVGRAQLGGVPLALQVDRVLPPGRIVWFRKVLHGFSFFLWIWTKNNKMEKPWRVAFLFEGDLEKHVEQDMKQCCIVHVWYVQTMGKTGRHEHWKLRVVCDKELAVAVQTIESMWTGSWLGDTRSRSWFLRYPTLNKAQPQWNLHSENCPASGAPLGPAAASRVSRGNYFAFWPDGGCLVAGTDSQRVVAESYEVISGRHGWPWLACIQTRAGGELSLRPKWIYIYIYENIWVTDKIIVILI